MPASASHKDVPSVLNLQPEGTESPLFCICGLHAYQALADRLAPRIPVFGMYLDAEHLPIEVQAASYVRTLREHQPAGPYWVAGFSFGGMLAYEAAQQLVSSGEEVRHVTMLDIWLPSALDRTRLRARLRRLRGRLRSRSDGRDEVVAEVMANYSVRPYAGAVRVVRAQGSLAYLGSILRDPSYGWGAFVTHLSVLDLPGDHVGVLGEPGVTMLADALRQDWPTLQAESI